MTLMTDKLFNFRRKRRIQILKDCSQLSRLYCTLFSDDSAKTAFFMEEIQFAAFNSLCQGSAYTLKGFWMTPTLTTLATPRNSLIYDVLNEILEKLVPAGIPKYLEDFHTQLLFKAYKPVVDGSPKPLKITDLSFGFVLWLCACGASASVFLVEVLVFRSWKILRNFVGLWIVWTILRMKITKLNL